MTKKEESKLTFDFQRILDERIAIDREVTDEINHFPTIRSEMLLVTNYVENILKDCIVCLTMSEHSRKISRNVIADILLDRNVISGDLFDDVKKIFKIRDQYGHSLRLSKIDEQIEPIILNLNIIKGFQQNFPDWDSLSTEDKFGKIIGLLNFQLKNCFVELAKKENLLNDEDTIW